MIFSTCEKKLIFVGKYPIKIIHAGGDTTIPFSDSEELVEKSKSKFISLIKVEDNHALVNYSTPDKMKEYITEVIAKLMLNTFSD